MLSYNRLLQRIRTLQYQAVVVRSIYLTVAHGEIFAAVDVDTIAISIYDDVVYGSKFTSRNDNSEVATTIYGNIANQYVAALLKGNSLVASTDVATMQVATILGISSCQSLAIDHTSTSNRNIVGSDGIDKAILEICVSSILICSTLKLLSFVVSLHRCWCCENL